jgi:hypothetical protein
LLLEIIDGRLSIWSSLRRLVELLIDDVIAVGFERGFESHKINQTTNSMREHPINMGVAPSTLYSRPPVVQMNESRTPQSYQQLERNNPEILDAFRSNPYTHSLMSAA